MAVIPWVRKDNLPSPRLVVIPIPENPLQLLATLRGNVARCNKLPHTTYQVALQSTQIWCPIGEVNDIIEVVFTLQAYELLDLRQNGTAGKIDDVGEAPKEIWVSPLSESIRKYENVPDSISIPVGGSIQILQSFLERFHQRVVIRGVIHGDRADLQCNMDKHALSRKGLTNAVPDSKFKF